MSKHDLDYEKEFKEFDDANPHIWALFVELAENRRLLGYRNFSARAILHQIRWRVGPTVDGSALKINNNTSAFYARKYHETFPRWNGFFRMRSMKRTSRRGGSPSLEAAA
jgi:hypothetical protein